MIRDLNSPIIAEPLPLAVLFENVAGEVTRFTLCRVNIR